MSKTTELNNTMALIEIWLPRLTKKDKKAIRQILGVMYNHAKQDGIIELQKRLNKLHGEE